MKKKDRGKPDLFNKERGRDEDEDNFDFDVVEKIKIRLLDGENNPFVPAEFKNSLVFFHPTKLIQDWSLGVCFVL
jgi:hypothetical protein